MNIDLSNTSQTTYSTLSATSKTNVTSSSENATSATIWTEEDSVEISAEAMEKLNESKGKRPPPPPEQMDFDSMSDEDLISYLQEMQELTGTVPGMAGDTVVSELTSEELSSIRTTLKDMAANGPQGGGEAGGGTPPPPPPETANVEDMTDDELAAYLKRMQEMTGQAPGVDNGTSVDSLSEEDMANIRSSLMTTA